MPADLHQRLLALVGEYRTSADADDYPVRFPLDALRAVVELHAPVTHYPGGDVSVGPRPQCFGCEIDGWDAEHPEWPCETVKTIVRELGIELSP